MRLTAEEAESLGALWDKDRQGDDRPLLGWPKRKAAERRVTARMRARGLADGAARVADRDTQTIVNRVDDVVRRAARHSSVQTEFAAAKAATDALRALAARDLIEPDGPGRRWTQAEYDLLTLPWRSMIGLVHPDDPHMRSSR